MTLTTKPLESRQKTNERHWAGDVTAAHQACNLGSPTTAAATREVIQTQERGEEREGKVKGGQGRGSVKPSESPVCLLSSYTNNGRHKKTGEKGVRATGEMLGCVSCVTGSPLPRPACQPQPWLAHHTETTFLKSPGMFCFQLGARRDSFRIDSSRLLFVAVCFGELGDWRRCFPIFDRMKSAAWSWQW